MVKSSVRKTIESNKDKLKSIVSSVIFLGKHGLPFRGTNDDTAECYSVLADETMDIQGVSSCQFV